MDLASALKGMINPEELTRLATSMEFVVDYERGVETVSAAGALSVTKKVSLLSVTGTTAYTLANGTFVGQEKVAICIAGASTPVGTITAATPLGHVNVTAIGAAGDIVVYIWTGAAWVVKGQIGCTIA